MNRDRLLLDAKAQAAALAESGYAPPQPCAQIPAPGVAALATEREKGLALEIENILLADESARRDAAPGKNVRDPASDFLVVL